MKFKFHIILILLLGLFLMPINALACGTKSTESCCSKKTAIASYKKNCCKKNTKNKTCDGKCGKSSCQTQNTSFGAILFNSNDTRLNLSVVSFRNLNFFELESPVSSGFYAIWLPPVIG